ncbi:MAG: hypothetical protein ABUL67_02405 [Haliangium ochraceum]
MPVCLSLAQCNGDTTQVVCLADLSTTDAGKKVHTFIETSNALITAAGEIDSDMLNVCKGMARDLAIPGGELEPASADADSPGAETKAACQRVRTEIDRIIKQDLVANARLSIVYTPTVCTIDAAAQLRCEQECDPVTVTVTRLECTPGHAYGQCMTSCMGTCTGSCKGNCEGSCTGTCNGSCNGRCNGACAGTCSAKNVDGTCYGTCTGQCAGRCDGSCTGTCSASCSGSCNAECMGTCEGSCSIWVQPPQCTEVQEVTTVEECKTNCEARAHFQADCTKPSLAVSYGYAATAAQTAALDRLVMALQNNYADLLKVGYRSAFVVKDAAKGYAEALDGITTTASQVGLGAGACVADAISRAAGAAAKVDISVSVSVSFSASLTTMGGVSAP